MNLKSKLEILGAKFIENCDFFEDVIKNLQLKSDSLILDIGTGRGKMAILLALYGFSVITGEPEGDNWADWQDNAQKLGVLSQIQFRNFTAEKLPFKDNSFNAVFALSSFHHFSDKPKALSEMSRIIKPDPNGIIVIFEYTEIGIENIRKKYPGHPDATNPLDFIGKLPLKAKIEKSELINAYILKKK
ncbi:MAG: class I SAM-dependent methyltransferase [Promethearchaeota archaeon]